MFLFIEPLKWVVSQEEAFWLNYTCIRSVRDFKLATTEGIYEVRPGYILKVVNNEIYVDAIEPELFLRKK